MRPPGLHIAEVLDARIITISPGPPPARPIRALLAAMGGLLAMAVCVWLLTITPLSIAGALLMVVSVLLSGGLLRRAMRLLQPRAPTTRTLRITATHLVLPEQAPVLLESITAAEAERDALRVAWGRGGCTIERLPTETARWLSDAIQQAAIRRRALPAQPVPPSLQAMRERP